MSSSISNPVTDNVGTGADSQSQAFDSRVTLVKVVMYQRFANTLENLVKELTHLYDAHAGKDFTINPPKISYKKLDEFLEEESSVWNCSTTSFSKRFREKRFLETWNNWCLKENVQFKTPINQGSNRCEIIQPLRKNSRLKALSSGKTICFVSSSWYNQCTEGLFRIFSTYYEFSVVEGIEVNGIVTPV